MITIDEFENRFPRINGVYFDSLSKEEKNTYIERVKRYYDAVLDIIITKLDLPKIEMSIDNSNNSFKAVDVLNQDLYQLMASGKLRYIYLRNNFYVERLSPEQLCLLDNPDNDISSLIEQTLKMVIDDFPEKPTITNYGPEAKVFYAKSSNLIIGVRVDDDFYPGGCNKVDLMLSRNFEIDFLKQYLESKVKEQMGIDCTVIRYSRDSVKSLKREKVEITEKTPK